MTTQDKRRAPRAEVKCACALKRNSGASIEAETVNLGPGGALLKCRRPLTIDESLAFDLDVTDCHIETQARVLRHEGHDTYALRFEKLEPTMAEQLLRFTQTG